MTHQENVLKRPLKIEEIDFRVQSINNGGYATILAYKDARVDMNRLDEAFGVFGWQRKHLRDNKNCIVSVWDDINERWVEKEDTGTESNTEQEKGLASDSFKRACFNLGIGRELYDYPIISIKLKSDEIQETGKQRPKYKASYNLNLRDWVWESDFDENNKLVRLSCKDSKGVKRYEYLRNSKNTTPKTTSKPILKLGSDEFKKALEAVKSGKFKVSDVEKKYTLNTSVKQALQSREK